jgi:hypothetical protein
MAVRLSALRTGGAIVSSTHRPRSTPQNRYFLLVVLICVVIEPALWIQVQVNTVPFNQLLHDSAQSIALP